MPVLNLPWFVYAMLLAPVALVVFAAIYKYLEVRAAADWPSVPGKIVTSNSEVRRVKVPDSSREDGHRFEGRNFANIVFEYAIAGQTYRNNRVTIGEDRGNFNVAETIARYPVGKPVTVYYNPARRNEAVLEREMPKGLSGCVGTLVAVVVAVIFGSVIGFNTLTEYAASHLADPKRSLPTVALAIFGTAAALFALALHRRASLAQRWPTVKGMITASGLEQFRGAASEGRRGSMMFKAHLRYAYRYNNVDYSSTVASLGGEVTSTSYGLLQRLPKKYPDGKIVDVYVNPDNPAEAVLEPRANGVWIVWIAAVALWALAFYVAHRA